MDPEEDIHESFKSYKERQIGNSETSESQESADSAHDIGVPEEKKMYILGEGMNNQTLMVLLFPTQNVWTKGEVIFSSRQFSLPVRRERYTLIEELTYFVRHARFPLNKIHNSGRDLAYCCLRRKGGGGKIMLVDQKIYGEDFYVDYDKILAVNLDCSEYTITRHKEINLRKLRVKEQIKNKHLSMAIQAKQGNMIIQKTLGIGQKMYINNGQILAISEQIDISRQKGSLVISGKGFVFFQNSTTNKIEKNILASLLFILFALILISSSI